VATCPTSKIDKPDEDFIPNVNGNPNWCRPYNYLINTYRNTDPMQYFGFVNIGVTWEGWFNFYRQGNPGYQAPKKITQIERSSEEWAVGDAWWDYRHVFVNPQEQYDVMIGTWQLASTPPGNPAGMSHNPLPRAPYHKFGEVTNLLYFDGHGGTFDGVDNWALEFPANRPEDDSD
jgi:hypothetical protein